MRLIFCWLCVWCSALLSRPLHLDINSRYAILMNAETGAILYEKESHIPTYPASTTKIATALYALEQEKLDLHQMLTVSPEAVRMKNEKNRAEAPPYWLESDGSSINLVRGEMLSFEALLHGLLLRSGNDAANVIAEGISGSVPAFMAGLNEYLAGIGCVNTQFYTPHGYHYENHKTTAHDLCLIARRALKNPVFRSIFSKDKYLCARTNKKQEREFKQTNSLVVKESREYYPKAIGGKTGYYGLAGYTLVAAAEHEGRTLISVTMGALKRKDAFADARNLFEAAFGQQLMERLLVPATQVYTKTIEGAKKPLQAIMVQDFSISYFPAEEPEVKAFVYWENLSLPIRKGAKVGTVQAFDQNHRCIGMCDLYAKDAVDKTFFFAIRESISKFIR